MTKTNDTVSYLIDVHIKNLQLLKKWATTGECPELANSGLSIVDFAKCIVNTEREGGKYLISLLEKIDA